MPAAALPPDEAARLAALRTLGVLDSPPDAEFDAIVRALSVVCGVPVAVLGLIDESREWYKAQVGLQDAMEAPRDVSFCAHTILANDVLEVEDASLDGRFADNPFVIGAPHIRFYAGAPLRVGGGAAVGALCVVDTQPRCLTDAQREILACHAAVASKCLENWRAAQLQAQAVIDLAAEKSHLRRLYEATPAMLHSMDEQGVLLAVSQVWLSKLGYTRDEVMGRRFAEFLTPEGRSQSLDGATAGFLADGSCQDVECRMVRKDGAILDVLVSAILDGDLADGGQRRSLVVIEDTTLRREAERALGKAHQRLTDIIESSGYGTWEWNVQTGAASVDERWAAMIGWAREDLPPLSNETRRDRTHPDDVTHADTQLAQHLSGAVERYEVEHRVRQRDGSWVWVHDVGAVITRTADGKPEWLTGIRQDISERKRQEDALRKSEEFLERVGRIAGVGGWELDLATQELYWSPETRRIHGVPADFQLTLAGALDLYAPEARPVLLAAIERATVAGEGWDLELPLVRWDGSSIWVRAVGFASFADGKAIRLSGALQDVTDQVAKRQALQRANERVKLATESGGIGIWDWDVATGALTWDIRTYRLYGLDPGDQVATYELWRATLHPDDRAATEQALHDDLVAKRSHDIEFRIVWTDGSVRHMRGAGNVTCDAEGHPVSMVGVVWDVTGSRELAIELERQILLQVEASERESALFSNSPDVLSIIRVDEELGERVFRYEAVSPALTLLTGWQPDQVLGRRLEECLDPATATATRAACEACIAQDATALFSAQIDTPRGRREIEGSRTPIRDPRTGKIVRIAGSMRDITERKGLEQAVHHGQKMEAIGRLAAGVAHDFNNILQSVSGSLEIVQDETIVGTKAHDFAGVGQRAAKRGSYLTHHLLAYARKQTLNTQLVELPLLLYDIEKLLGRTLGPSIALTVRVDLTVPLVRVDPGQMQTALLNLAINASHAMADGGALLIESRRVCEAERQWVAIAVTDNGVGMDAATLARATEPFYTTKGLKGTGLGLSMVQGFVEQSGGRILLTSAPGRGTTVTLTFPTIAAEPRDNVVNARSMDMRPSTVLLVDDDTDVLLTIGASLDTAGFTTLLATNAAAALALLLDGARIDAVVTDYAMPGMNGGDLVAEIRRSYADLPAVVISGFSDLSEAESLGADIVMIRKPFARDMLVQTLRRLLRLSRPTEELFATLRPRLDEP